MLVSHVAFLRELPHIFGAQCSAGIASVTCHAIACNMLDFTKVQPSGITHSDNTESRQTVLYARRDPERSQAYVARPLLYVAYRASLSFGEEAQLASTLLAHAWFPTRGTLERTCPPSGFGSSDDRSWRETTAQSSTRKPQGLGTSDRQDTGPHLQLRQGQSPLGLLR
jgi:hypothetical protein